MTDMNGSRLWPLALMAWLAACPLPGEEGREPGAEAEVTQGRPAGWLQASRPAAPGEEGESRPVRQAARMAGKDGA